MSFHLQADVDKVTANIERLASEISGVQSAAVDLKEKYTLW